MAIKKLRWEHVLECTKKHGVHMVLLHELEAKLLVMIQNGLSWFSGFELQFTYNTT
jgi:hypothetical protein